MQSDEDPATYTSTFEVNCDHRIQVCARLKYFENRSPPERYIGF